MKTTTFLLIVALFALLIVLFGVVRRLNQQEREIQVLTTSVAAALDLMGYLARSNKTIASSLKDTMIQVEGHSKIFISMCKKKEEE